MIFIDNEQQKLTSATSRGFLYGDGIFTTIKVDCGKFCLEALHIQRLIVDAKKLSLTLPNLELLFADAKRQIGTRTGVLRFTICRGIGVRGYRYDESTAVDIFAWFNEHEFVQSSKRLKLRWCDTKLSSFHPLAGVKHLNRIEQVMARNEWHNNEYDDGLLCDSQGNVLETTCANIFVIKDDKLMTPLLNSNGVLGVTRQHIINCLSESDSPVIECKLTRPDILSSSEIFITNAIQGIVSVESLGKVSYDCVQTKQVIEQVEQFGSF